MSESTRAFIAQTAKRHDEAQIGMTRKEVICMMMHLTGGTSDQCECRTRSWGPGYIVGYII